MCRAAQEHVLPMEKAEKGSVMALLSIILTSFMEESLFMRGDEQPLVPLSSISQHKQTAH